MSYYALVKGWLLLGLPFYCLRLSTRFRLTLNQHLGTLTQVWIVLLSVTGLIPVHPIPEVYDADRFGV